MGGLQLFGAARVIACDHRAVGEVRRLSAAIHASSLAKSACGPLGPMELRPEL